MAIKSVRGYSGLSGFSQDVRDSHSYNLYEMFLSTTERVAGFAKKGRFG